MKDDTFENLLRERGLNTTHKSFTDIMRSFPFIGLSASKEASKKVRLSLDKNILVTWEEVKHEGQLSIKVNHLLLADPEHKLQGKELLLTILNWLEAKGAKPPGRRNLDEQKRVTDKIFYAELVEIMEGFRKKHGALTKFLKPN
jgi:hypothetical protein